MRVVLPMRLFNLLDVYVGMHALLGHCINDWKPWFWAAKIWVAGMIRKRGLTVLGNLFWSLKVAFVGVHVVEFAIIRRVISTNLRTRFVDAAPIIAL